MDKINKQGLIPIYARIIADKKIELSTTIFTKQGEWNDKSQRLKSSCDDAEGVNACQMQETAVKMFMAGVLCS